MSKDNKVFLIGSLLFGGSFLFSLFFINEGLFHFDSVILAKAVEDMYRTGHLQAAVSGRFGAVIINAILYLPFYLFGQNADFLTRFSSVLFYSLSIPVFFIFINDLFKDRIQGLFAAILLAVTPFYLVPNTYGKEHGMSMFFFLCSMVLVNKGREEKRPITLALASLCFMIALSVRESMLFMLPFYFWLYFRPAIGFGPLRFDVPQERLNGRCLSFLILPIVILFGFLMFFYLGMVIQNSLSTDESFVPHFCGFFSKNLIRAVMDAGNSFPGYFLFFAILGAGIIWQERRYFLLVFFLIWSCLILVYGNFDGYVPRHLDAVVLAEHAFVSYFLAWVYRRFRFWAILVFIFLITSQLINLYPMLEFRRHYDGTLRLASFARINTPENAVFLTEDEAPFIEYYGKRKTISFPVGHWEDSERVFKEIGNLIDRQIPVYVIPSSYVLYGGTIPKDKFFEEGPQGRDILAQLIQTKVLRDFSSTQVSFQLNNDLKTKAIRKISKGDWGKISTIFEQAEGQFDRDLLDRFKVSLVGEVLFEDYHRAELNLNLYIKPIYKFEYGRNRSGRRVSYSQRLHADELVKRIPL